MWAYTLAGCGLDDSTEEFILPFKQFVRQRPHELIATKSLYEAAPWELCILLWGGTSIEHGTVEVAGRTSWMRAYLDDFRYLDHKKSKRFQVEDDAYKGGKKKKGRGEGKFYDGERLQRPASFADRRTAKGRRSRSRSLLRRPTRAASRSRSPVFHFPQPKPVPTPKKACSEFQRGECVKHGACPKGAAHKCIVCGKANHGAHQCWSR